MERQISSRDAERKTAVVVSDFYALAGVRAADGAVRPLREERMSLARIQQARTREPQAELDESLRTWGLQ